MLRVKTPAVKRETLASHGLFRYNRRLLDGDAPSALNPPPQGEPMAAG
jgi:hypothetical protein